MLSCVRYATKIAKENLRLGKIDGANVTSEDLTNPGDTTAPILQDQDITVTLLGTGDNIADVTDGSGVSDIGIIAVDVQATNGVIHVLNKVMIPNLN